MGAGNGSLYGAGFEYQLQEVAVQPLPKPRLGVDRARCSRLFLFVLVKYCSSTGLSLGGAIIFADEEAKLTTARETALELAFTLLRPPRFHVRAIHCQITAFLSSKEACPSWNWSWGHMSPHHHSASFPRPAVLYQ